jgi:hypothetical protein
MLSGQRQREEATAAGDVEDLQRLALSTPVRDELADHLGCRGGDAHAGGRERLPERVPRCLGVLIEDGAAVANDLRQTLVAAPRPGRSEDVHDPAKVARSAGD